MTKISIAAVGPPGCGKSTIGNVLLGGSMLETTPFRTGSGSNSVTLEPKTEHKGNLYYTDLPGLPDKTNETKTKDNYNRCVAELCKGHSAILFVFQKDRNDVRLYTRERILFRELSKASGEKILVMNDRTRDYSRANSPSAYDNELRKQARKIKQCTGIDFQKDVFLNEENMKEKLEELASSLGPKQGARKLKDFEAMKVHVQKLKTIEEARLQLIADGNEEIKDLQRSVMKHRALALSCIGAMGIGAGVAVVAFPAIALSGAAIAPFCYEVRQIETAKKTKRKKEAEVKRNVSDADAQRYLKAAKEFKELVMAVDARSHGVSN